MRAREGWLKNSRNAIYSGVMSAIIDVAVIIYLCFYVVVAFYFNLGICEVEWNTIKVDKIDQKMPKAKSTLRVRKHRDIDSIPYLRNEDQGKQINYNHITFPNLK